MVADVCKIHLSYTISYLQESCYIHGRYTVISGIHARNDLFMWENKVFAALKQSV